MFTVIANLINAALGRPSVAKAVLCSLGLHVSVVAATFSWWSVPVDQMTLAGKRNVVQLETAFAAERAEHAEEMEVSVERFMAPPRPREDGVEPLPVNITQAISPLNPVEPESSPVNLPEDQHNLVDPQFSRREVDDLIEKPAEIPPRDLPRREPEILMPETSVAAEQVAGLDDKTPPDFQGNDPPAYPATAIARSLEGTVLLRLHIAATGHVTRVDIVTSSGHDVLDRAAVEAVSTWRGRPAHQAGTPLATIELLPIRFRL